MPLDIKTARLRLRPWRETDVQRFLAIYGDEQVWRWLGATPAPLTDPEIALSRIKRWAGLFDGPCGIWAVVPDDETEPVGTVLLLHLPDKDGNLTDDIEIGWHFMPPGARATPPSPPPHCSTGPGLTESRPSTPSSTRAMTRRWP